MRRFISKEVRDFVAKRANYVCEYCHYPEEHSYGRFQIEHIRPLKHNGTDDLTNLAYACAPCNRAKGSNIGTYLGRDEIFTRLYHPRRDRWPDHFYEDAGKIMARTQVGRSTIHVLDLNGVDKIIERQRIAKFEKR